MFPRRRPEGKVYCDGTGGRGGAHRAAAWVTDAAGLGPYAAVLLGGASETVRTPALSAGRRDGGAGRQRPWRAGYRAGPRGLSSAIALERMSSICLSRANASS